MEDDKNGRHNAWASQDYTQGVRRGFIEQVDKARRDLESAAKDSSDPKVRAAYAAWFAYQAAASSLGVRQ